MPTLPDYGIQALGTLFNNGLRTSLRSMHVMRSARRSPGGAQGPSARASIERMALHNARYKAVAPYRLRTIPATEPPTQTQKGI